MPRTKYLLLWLTLLTTAVYGQVSLTADEIMARVAANQDRTVELRSHYIYRQHVHATSHKTNGKLMREETDDFDVFPSAKGSERKLQSLVGRYWHKGSYLEFKGKPIPDPGSIDANLTHDFLSDTDGDRSKDGILSHLFPLTTTQQKDYRFKMIGEELFQSRHSYRIGFAPKDDKELDWTGEAYIDKEEFQPIYVFTKPSRKIPFFVRSVLGVDLPGIGFNVQYRRQEDGVWFPESFGTEFEIHLFHIVSRTVTLSLKNSDFKKTRVDTTITLPETIQ